jgi:predicted RNase H-like nuclease (RuvC/YqgF family)
MSKEFICKGCGEKFNKDMQSNNVGYCYICNEFYMRKQIADLEAKLEESERVARNNKTVAELVSAEHNAKIEKLEQQLAEKEKEISVLKSQLCLCQISQSIDQDKISFAVKQLNLLYKTLTIEDVWREMKKGWWLNNGECKQLRQLIDNQIEELKKGSE